MKTSVGLWSYSHKAITTNDYGYGRSAQDECGADFAVTTLNAAAALPLLTGGSQMVAVVVDPWNPAKTVREYALAGLTKHVVFWVVCDEPEIGMRPPGDISSMVFAIRSTGTTIPILLNTFVSQRVFRETVEPHIGIDETLHMWDKVMQAHDEMNWALGGIQSSAPQMPAATVYDALDYLGCGHDVHTFDYYPQMGTQDCSWLSKWADLSPQFEAFAAFKGELGYIGQAFHFRKCGVADVSLASFKQGLAMARQSWGDRLAVYLHYAHVPSNSEGVFPPDDPKLRADMRTFHEEVNTVAVHPVISPELAYLTPSGQGSKIACSIVRNGATCVNVVIGDPSLVEGIPTSAVNAGWWTVNARGVVGKTTLAYEFDNGARVLQNVVVESLPPPPTVIEVSVDKDLVLRASEIVIKIRLV